LLLAHYIKKKTEFQGKSGFSLDISWAKDYAEFLVRFCSFNFNKEGKYGKSRPA
jgi:hypothetical protein